MRMSRRRLRKPTINLLLYFIIAIFYLETVLRVSTSGSLLDPGLVFSILYALGFSIILYGLVSLFCSKTSYILSSISLLLLTLIFSSQLVYYKIFRTFYTFYSARNVGQVFEFWREGLAGVLGNIPLILVLFVPFIIFLFLGSSLVSPAKLSFRHIVVLLVSLVIVHFIALAGIHLGGRDENTPYTMYFNSNYPNFSINNLGLLTSIRLDTQRTLTGWTPQIENPIVEVPDPEPGEEEEPVIGGEEDPDIEPVIEYNVMDIDFDKLIANETDEEMKKMHEYFKNTKPTKKNDYTGLYEGYNLIVFTAEAFSHMAVRPDITPTLYKMVNEGYNFKNFYTPVWGVSTSDGEYVANTGLIPKSGVWSFMESSKIDMPFAMGNQLKKLGYSTRAYHNHTYTYYDRHLSHPNLGYDYKGVGNGLEVRETWPESDLEMMEVTIPEFINDQPFHSYFMTVSGHLRYTFTGNYIAYKNRDLVADLPYSDHVRAYLATQIELDRALEYLLEKLEEAGIADKTLIALSSDHYPYGLEHEEIEELEGKPVDDNFELYRNSFILYTKGMEAETIEKPVSSLDIIPTISNLLGLEFDSRLLMGRDVFSDEDPLVIFSNRSFITDKGRYNSKTKTFTPNPGVEVDEDYRTNISNLINARFFYSAKILDTDYFKIVLEN